MCKKYVTDRAPLTGKKDGKAIKRLNAAQRMHEGLYHEDVVGLEQEYSAKMEQFNEYERKTLKVDPEQVIPNSTLKLKAIFYFLFDSIFKTNILK